MTEPLDANLIFLFRKIFAQLSKLQDRGEKIDDTQCLLRRIR